MSVFLDPVECQIWVAARTAMSRILQRGHLRGPFDDPGMPRPQRSFSREWLQGVTTQGASSFQSVTLQRNALSGGGQIAHLHQTDKNTGPDADHYARRPDQPDFLPPPLSPDRKLTP